MPLKQSLQRIPVLVSLVRLTRKLARPARFLVWHTPIEPFRSELVKRASQVSGRVLDLAGGARRLTPDVLNLDYQVYAETNVQAEAGALPIAGNSIGLVWCEAALEHFPDPGAAVAEILRVLKPGGWVYVEVPFMQGYHADPGDFQRFTTEGLRRLFGCYEIEWCQPCSGPASAWAYASAGLGAALVSGGSRWLYKIAFHYVFVYLFAPFKFLDRFLICHPECHRTAFGLALLARKPNRVSGPPPHNETHRSEQCVG